MSAAPPMRRLPSWIAGGPEVSDVAYRIVELAFDAPTTLDTREVSLVEVVDHVAALLEVDAADICRALAELERAGVLSTRRTEEAL